MKCSLFFLFLSVMPFVSLAQQRAVKAKELQYISAPSDLPNVNFKIIYLKEDRQHSYMADTGYMADSAGEAADADSGKVYIVFSHKHCRQFYVSQKRIRNILHIRYNSSVYDNTDVVFTKKRIYMVHSYASKTSKSIFSDVFIVPKAKTGFEYQKLFQNLEEADQPERDIFYASILYCQVHKLKM